MHKNFKGVEKTVFGKGSFNRLKDLVEERRTNDDGFILFLVDHFFKDKPLALRVPATPEDMIHFVDVDTCEPTTEQVDSLRDYVLSAKGLPAVVVGIGGGSVLDIAKAVSLMLTQEGSSALCQGLNLIKKPGVYHIGVPTLSGTGAEVSMMAVFTGPTKKLGLKCDWTVFNQIILDSELTEGVPKEQWFYTGVDTYIHCMESQNGIFSNAYSLAYAEQALQICRAVFLEAGSRQTAENSDNLMVVSLMGGLSLTYSEVGVCHALSYSLSKVSGLRHSYANCVAFNHFEDYYPDRVDEFRGMVQKQGIELPQRLSKKWSTQQITVAAEVSYGLSHTWHHALGKQRQGLISSSDTKTLFRRM